MIKVLEDLINSFGSWRIFYLIGISDIRKRYARSKLGQFWLTLSLAVNIGSLGVVWSYLFRISINDYLPYVAFSIIFWSYLSNCLIEGASVFITCSSYLRELRIAKTSYICSLFIKNFVILGHNLIILVPIYFCCSFIISIHSLITCFFGFVLTTLFLFPIVLFLSTLSLRFRDFPNIIASGMQIVFYITPVMWKGNLLPVEFHKYLIFNPFAVFLSICRDGFFTSVPPHYFIAAIIYIIFAWIIAIPFYSKFRARIIYWL